MPSQKHADLVKYAQNKLIENGKVLRLDSKISPDLIFVSKNGKVCAVEIELTHSGICEVKRNLNSYSDFDKVFILTCKKKDRYNYVFKSKRYYTKEIYDFILKLTKEHKSQSQIKKEGEIKFKRKIPQSTISMIQNGHRKWSKSRNKVNFKIVWIRIK